jgi:hypothetical protein
MSRHPFSGTDLRETGAACGRSVRRITPARTPRWSVADLACYPAR